MRRSTANPVFPVGFGLYRIPKLMSRSPYLEWLAELFDEHAQRLNASTNSEERTLLLRRMKILLDKIDGEIASSLEDGGDTPIPASNASTN